MTTREIKSKWGYLKFADWSATEGAAGPDLETMLKSILDATSAQNRQWSPSKSNRYKRVIVDHVTHAGVLVGQLIEFEVGKSLRFVRNHQDSNPNSSIEVADEKIPKTKEGKTQDHLESSLYFAVSKNLVAFMQSSSLRSKAFEEHIGWLFKGNSLGYKKGKLIIKDQFIDDAVQKIEKYGVSVIKLGMPLDEIFDDNLPKDAGIVDLTQRFFPGRITSSLYKDLKAGFSEVETSGLTATVALSAPAKAGAEAKRLLNTLAIGMRHDTDNMVIVLGNKEELKGKKLVRKGKFEVEFFDGIPADTQVYAGLTLLLEGKLSSLSDDDNDDQ